MIRIIGNAPPVPVYCGTAYASAVATTFNFAGQSISDADSSRFVLVAVTGSGSIINSCTIGGVAGARLDDGDAVGTNAKMYGAVVPTGTTATISVVMSASVSNAVSITTWAVYNLNSTTPRDQSSSLSDPAVLDLDVRARGVAFVIATSNLNAATYTISGFTADLTVTTAVGNWPRVAGHVISAAGGTPVALGVNYSSSAGGPRAVAISLR